MAWRWTDEREKAAAMVAVDELGDRQIAESIGIDPKTLTRWKQSPEFSERVKSLVAAAREEAKRYVIADKDARVGAADALRTKLLGVFEERGQAPEMQIAAGGKSGLLVRTLKSIGAGPLAQVVEEFAVDTGSIRSLLDVQEYASRELGQLPSKHEHSGPGGKGPIPVIVLPSIVPLNEDEIQEMALPAPKKR